MEDLSLYREVFVEELVDQLDRIEQDLLVLEKETSDEVVQSIFRAAHTIKGSSAAMGFEEMKSLTHEMEHLLDQVRSKKLQVDRDLVDLLFVALDGIKDLKDQYTACGTLPDISDVLERLRGFAKDTKAPVKMKELPELTLEQALQLEEFKESGLQPLKIQIRFAKDCPMKMARFQLVALEINEKFGAVVSSDPALPINGQLEDEAFADAVFMIGSGHDLEEIRSYLADMTDVEQVMAEPYQFAKKLSKPAPAAKEAVSEERQKQGAQTIRVSVERLEHLMNLVGELLIDQTSLSELKRSLSRRFSNEDFVNRLTEVSDHMAHIVEELQESVMKARMLPIEHLFNRFPRMVRDLSQKLGKDIALVLEGMETELDRTLIEEIGDPLIHLIRNAVDHGIEAADERERKGKPAKGRVRLNSFHEDNQVVITIEDDGAGIDPEKIKASAIRKGIITPEEAQHLSEQELVHLIFQPGFSTAATVSDVSGRGVGMDIVRNQIERLNGLIDIQTKLGEGTCFTVRLPLTLAIITGLMVNVAGRQFVVPMNNVLEIVKIPMDEIQSIQGEQVIIMRNQVIPLIWLQDVLQYEKKADVPKNLPAVVIGSAEKKMALAVDELLGNQEIVIKTLGSFLGKVPFMTGATILGNGRVALILDAVYLIQTYCRRK
ncbi:chemotaxis protein CheA [Paenibacillus hamazuiensis]|uniref:chemotaxis protein CheA n=1 Tax=Paenibacillus hamazuiensis TaxID=2936508 RepID=UPI00200F638A|nr:chemotaxis protein CheA [Paenibacillus hamazuiensis]